MSTKQKQSVLSIKNKQIIILHLDKGELVRQSQIVQSVIDSSDMVVPY